MSAGARAVGSSLDRGVSLPFGSTSEGSAVFLAALALSGDRGVFFAGTLLAADLAGVFLAPLAADLLAGLAGTSTASAVLALSGVLDCGGADWSPFAVPRDPRALGATWQTPYPTRA